MPDSYYFVSKSRYEQSCLLIATDNNECRDTMTKQVSYFPVPPIIVIKPTKYIACVPETITFTNLSVPIDETYDISC